MIAESLRRLLSPRRIDIIEHVLSVLLAILTAHILGAANINWAAFTGYMVLRGHLADTITRGVLRMAGTLGGGLVALLIVPRIEGIWALQALALFVICSLMQYGAIVGRRAYAWLFAGLTFSMILFDTLERPGLELANFFRSRVLETGAGTLACLGVGTIGALTLRRLWPAQRTPIIDRPSWDASAARHAAQSGVALALLAVLSAFVPLPGLAQAPITIMAVMLVPVSTIGRSGLLPVSHRMAQRLAGCMGGAAFAAATLMIAGASTQMLIAGTVLGVIIGRLIETGEHTRSYVGTQFALAVLVVLVPDSYTHADMTPGWHRLLGILIGMAALAPVLLAWHWISPWTIRRRAPSNDI